MSGGANQPLAQPSNKVLDSFQISLQRNKNSSLYVVRLPELILVPSYKAVVLCLIFCLYTDEVFTARTQRHLDIA